MQSSELATIYRNAADTIALRLKRRPDVQRVLDAVEARVLSPVTDPRKNRRLFIEPELLSQTVGVPYQTVEDVIAELRRFNFIHVWAKALCPLNDEDNVIVETDDPNEFREALKESCHSCGQYHDEWTPATIETVYAVHVGSTADRFSFGRFFIPKNRLLRPLQPPPDQRGFRRFFVGGAGTPLSNPEAEKVAQQLEVNGDTSRLPAPHVTASLFLVGVLVWAVLTCAAFIVGRRWLGLFDACVITVICLVAGAVVIYLSLRSIFAATPQRSLTTFGFTIAAALLISSVEYRVEGGETTPINGEIGSAAPSFGLACCAVAMGCVTVIAVAAITIAEGWFSRQKR